MSKVTTGPPAEKIVLHSDNGAELAFFGRVFSESSHFDEATGTLTKLRLFITETNSYVYSFVSTTGIHKQRRHYAVEIEGSLCRMNDGKNTLVLPAELLFSAVFGLCGIDPACAEELRPALAESLLAAKG